MDTSMLVVGYSFSATCTFKSLMMPGEISVDCGLGSVVPMAVGFGERIVSSFDASRVGMLPFIWWLVAGAGAQISFPLLMANWYQLNAQGDIIVGRGGIGRPSTVCGCVEWQIMSSSSMG